MFDLHPFVGIQSGISFTLRKRWILRSFPLWLAPAVVSWCGPPVLPVLLHFITDFDRSFKFQFGANVQFDRVQDKIVEDMKSYEHNATNSANGTFLRTVPTFERYHPEMITMPLRHNWRYQFEFCLYSIALSSCRRRHLINLAGVGPQTYVIQNNNNFVHKGVKARIPSDPRKLT